MNSGPAIEQVVRTFHQQNQTFYEIRWKGLDQTTIEPESNVKHLVQRWIDNVNQQWEDLTDEDEQMVAIKKLRKVVYLSREEIHKTKKIAKKYKIGLKKEKDEEGEESADEE